MPGGVALHPVLRPAARPVGAAAGSQRAVQRLVIHPAQHQHLASVVLLGYGGEPPGHIFFQPGDDPRVQAAGRSGHHGHPASVRWSGDGCARSGRRIRTGYPAARSDSFTSLIASLPKWNKLAASTASAPACTAGAKSASWPAPPLAITGTSTTWRIARISGRSNPAWVPSASIELSRISPAPSSTARTAHCTASSPAPRRPPWVVSSKLSGPAARRASTDTTTRCEPNRAATSVSSSGRGIAAVFSDTLSA